MSDRLRVGIDTGGTFTDVVVLDEATGALTATKTPSTPHDHSIGFLTGAEKALASLPAADWAGVGSVFHGTTVATNALLQGEVEGLGFLTTAGFRHLLEIGRQSVPDGYGNSYFWVKPDRIVPLHLVREVPERLDATGAVLRPLDEAAVVAQARWFRDHGVRAVGVCLLHAYANPAHERRVRDLFAEAYPECSVSISSDVLREYREYERSVTTLVDAFVKPAVASYVERLAAQLDGRTATRVPFYVMKSNGGVTSAGQVARKPITTVLSGPAAGALGAAAVTHAAGFDEVVTLDGGGTSTDVAVIRSGAPSLTTEATVGRFPAKVPMIDIVTVGAGGGSIAWVSPEGTLKVGPRSAGADPGPLCYGRGGTEPTLTDAALVLGRIPPHLLAGEMPLDAEAARAGIDALAGELALTPEACAEGILEIWAWNQANAIRQVTVRRGIDVRDLALCAFGGSGPLQAGRLLDVLELAAAVVPPDPGNLCAFGLLTVDVRLDDVRTFVAKHAELDLAALAAVYKELEDEAGASLAAEGFDPAEQRFLRSADLRYDGQAFEVRVDVPGGPVDADLAAAVLDRFHDEHERLYGYCYRARPHHGVEWVNVRLTGVGPLEAPAIAPVAAGSGEVPAGATRPVFFDGAWHDTPVAWRGDLGAGDEVGGPAVIEEYGSTLPVPPGVRVVVDRLGTLVVRREGAEV
ncbi:MAG TPA: hydantoinase/oxoprolinase family protein [Acidimicrobiales bacterium]|nr:hydantoinase/oxoprolinase family protein [Acidimicrobiales bacterium]